MSPSRRLALALLLALAPTLALAQGGSLTVTTLDDHDDGICDADCSLREAIVAANALAGADDVVLPAGNYVLTLADTDEDLAANGDLDITDALTIAGPTAGTTFIDGNNATRVLHVLTNALVQVLGVRIRNGNTAGFGGGIHYEGNGTLALNGVIVSGNTAGGFGGGINNNAGGTISLVNADVTGNTAAGFGGGINNNVGGSVTLQNVGVIRPGYSAELDGVVERSRHAREWIANLEAVERARTEALKWVDSLEPTDQMVVLLAGANTEVKQSATSEKAALRRALQACAPSDSPTPRRAACR